MCGIIVVLTATPPTEGLKNEVMKLRRKIRHRGPDYSGMVVTQNMIMAHERLSIIDPFSGEQPFKNTQGDILAVNGEIYNYKELQAKYQYPYQTRSDCEVLMAFDTTDHSLIDELSGMYGFCKWDSSRQIVTIARDPIGIIPLYYGYRGNELWVASELKVLDQAKVKYQIFPPGHVAVASVVDGIIGFSIQSTPLYNRLFTMPHNYPQPDHTITDTTTIIRRGLKAAVKKMLMSDVPIGSFLSGGLDSSLVTSIACHYLKKSGKTEKLKTFAVGLADSPDLIQARKVAEFLGTEHHELIYTIEEGIAAIRDVVWYIETYDVTTIRSSIPMYLLSKRIRSMGIKMVLSGEGSDELFGGYLYFHKAPSPKDFHEETVRKVQQLYMYDCLRANKAPAAASLECRPPFLDTQFVEQVLGINTNYKMVTADSPMEKGILRRAFDDHGRWLPDEILWRTKMQFSDGTGFDWIDSLKAHAAISVSDEDFEDRYSIFPLFTPKTKEAFLYRSIFEEYYPLGVETVPYGDSVACSSQVAMEWDESFKNVIDPSGRSMSFHVNSFQ